MKIPLKKNPFHLRKSCPKVHSFIQKRGPRRRWWYVDDAYAGYATKWYDDKKYAVQEWNSLMCHLALIKILEKTNTTGPADRRYYQKQILKDPWDIEGSGPKLRRSEVDGEWTVSEKHSWGGRQTNYYKHPELAVREWNDMMRHIAFQKTLNPHTYWEQQ